MRVVIAAVLVVVSCSRPLPVSAVPDEAKPSGATQVAPGKFRFVMSTSHEISCSHSFETHGTYVSWELSIDESAHATLTASGSEGTTFGPSDAKFKSPGSSSVHHESRAIEERWVGSARTTSEGVELELGSEKKTWRLACKNDRVEAQLPYGKATDAGAAARVDVLSCTPTRHVPMDDEKHIRALLFAKAPGLEHSVHDYGWGGDHVSLRLLAGP